MSQTLLQGNGKHDKANFIDYFGRKVNYSLGAYNKYNDTEQWIRLSEGCPNQCPFCYEPREFKVFPIPEIVRNQVKIMDMNLFAKPEALAIINELAEKRVNGKVVYYELVCGVDWRFLTQEQAYALKAARFDKIRLAWDFDFKLQLKIKDAIDKLFKAGYKPKKIMVFFICNWLIPYEENLRKLDLCKVWGVQAADCYYDNQLSPNIIPIYWTSEQIKDFKRRVRKHNQLVTFRIDPEAI
jgi:hypothetical protein